MGRFSILWKVFGSRHKLISPSIRSVPDELFRKLGETRIQINNDREIIGKKICCTGHETSAVIFLGKTECFSTRFFQYEMRAYFVNSSWNFCVIEKQFLRQRIFISEVYWKVKVKLDNENS